MPGQATYAMNVWPPVEEGFSDGLFGPPDVEKLEEKRDIKGLAKALRDKHHKVRYATAEALGKIGAPAVEPLIAALRDEEVNVCWAAVEALKKLGVTDT